MKTCPRCGGSCNPDFVSASPFKVCPTPGCDMPLDMDALDGMHPVPGRADPKADAKIAKREQALTDFAAFKAS